MQVASFVAGESGSLDQLERALWGIRYTVLLQLRHWKLRALDVWTIEPKEVASDEAERIFQSISSISSSHVFQA
jgi:hypothetical protein